jgi:hypothetical protein
MLLKLKKRSVCYFGIGGDQRRQWSAYAKEQLKMDNFYNGAVITDLKEDKVILNKLTQEQIHELYEYSIKSKPISLRILMVK